MVLSHEVIWLTNQRECEPVIQITVCKVYFLLLVPQIYGTSMEPNGRFWVCSLLCTSHYTAAAARTVGCPWSTEQSRNDFETEQERTTDGIKTERQRVRGWARVSYAQYGSLAQSQRWGEGARWAPHLWHHQTVPICGWDSTGIEGEQLELVWASDPLIMKLQAFHLKVTVSCSITQKSRNKANARVWSMCICAITTLKYTGFCLILTP